ncbi:16S rRNA (cytosine(1402)-N(4))-methyltransferase RsmH [Patescibacteria group bacterium]|nr:16S rRNA (cytosine(1402)-N(4))-methyltransferase RsmH [Patescibacteria group bacterium]MBU1931661.1 16S rRNA (cytosine(1402)-N(4))-methyltransferase RsmH [Patescibacteria group bacterium]
MTSVHQPVMLKQAIEYLNVQPGEAYFDATVGGGGHAQAILAAGGRLYGIDRDPQAVRLARERLTASYPQGGWQVNQADFVDLKTAVQVFKLNQFSGILFDLGLSSDQLADRQRGFSFQLDGPLDMRMDPVLNVTAADLLKVLNKGELYELFKKLGEEKRALRLAQAIIDARQQTPITTSKQLADLAMSVCAGRRGKLHPATKMFQALRIAVNDELNNLKAALPQAIDLLKAKGRLVVISFHGLEDRIVKHCFKDLAVEGVIRLLTKKPIQPELVEVKANPRARSAKLRAAEKV